MYLHTQLVSVLYGSDSPLPREHDEQLKPEILKQQTQCLRHNVHTLCTYVVIVSKGMVRIKLTTEAEETAAVMAALLMPAKMAF